MDSTLCSSMLKAFSPSAGLSLRLIRFAGFLVYAVAPCCQSCTPVHAEPG